MKPNRSFQTSLWLLPVFLLVGVLNASGARAAGPWTVTKTADTNDGACDTDCSLREAIAAASPGDTINFAPSVSGTITLALGALAINKSLTINGPGASILAISGGGASRVVNISAGTVSISGLTVRDGGSVPIGAGILNLGATATILTGMTIANNSSTDSGAGVYSTTPITLTGVMLTDNTSGGSGGGVYSAGSTTLAHTNVTSNTANFGGGIGNEGTLLLNNAIVSGNSSTPNYGGGISNSGAMTLTNVLIANNVSNTIGGGIFNGGTLTSTLTNVTISGNTATNNFGGGLHNNTGATINLANVTLSTNTAKSWGGGISNSGEMSVVNSTVANNQLSPTPGASGITTFGALTLKNTIIANNAGGNCDNIFTSLGHNLSSDATCNGSLVDPSDLKSTDPLLGALANNGGSVPTHALSGGSLAIDAGTDTGCPSTDARGAVRPEGTHCDMGAYEYGAAPTLSSISPSSALTGGPAFTLTLTGTNFISGTVAQWASSSLATAFISSTQLTATVPAGNLSTSGTFNVTVQNPGPGDGVSGALPFLVNKLDQTITFGPLPGKRIGDLPFTVGATASSGLPVTFTTSGQCTNSGSTVTLTGAGSCTVTAHQVGNGVYNAAPDVSQSFAITQSGLYLPMIIR